MTELGSTKDEPPSDSVGHVAVHLDDQHPREVSFLLERQAQRMPRAMALSTLVACAVLRAGGAGHPLRPQDVHAGGYPELPDCSGHHLAQQAWPWRRRWRRRQPVAGTAAEGGAARQGQDDGAGDEAARTGAARREAEGRSPAPAGAEHPRQDDGGGGGDAARCPRGDDSARTARRSAPARVAAREPALARASAPVRVPDLVRAGAAARAAAPTGQATASNRRCW